MAASQMLCYLVMKTCLLAIVSAVIQKLSFHSHSLSTLHIFWEQDFIPDFALFYGILYQGFKLLGASLFWSHSHFSEHFCCSVKAPYFTLKSAQIKVDGMSVKCKGVLLIRCVCIISDRATGVLSLQKPAAEGTKLHKMPCYIVPFQILCLVNPVSSEF